MSRKRLCLTYIVSLWYLLCCTQSIIAAEANYFDTSQASKGIVFVNYTGAETHKLKLIIEKGEQRYTYNLYRNVKDGFPLQLGTGTYKLKILKNVSGASYSLVAAKEIDVIIKDSYAVYLNSVQNIEWTNESQAIKKAILLTKDEESLQGKANILYTYMVKNYQYDYKKLSKVSSDYLPNIDNTLKVHKGICYDFSSLYAAMLRSQGIPAKLVKGYSDYVSGYHAWNEVYDTNKKKWIVIDTTYDLQLYERKKSTTMTKASKDYEKVNEY